jgi:hypothetical protein
MVCTDEIIARHIGTGLLASVSRGAGVLRGPSRGCVEHRMLPEELAAGK